MGNFRRGLLAPCWFGLLLASGSVQALCPTESGSSVRVTYNDSLTSHTFKVLDGDPLDLDPLPRGIIFNFEIGTVVLPPQPWVANGTVRAISYPDGYAQTLLTDVLIENVGGPVDDVELIAEHCFDNQITVPMVFKAPVDGAILNTADGIIQARAELEYMALVNDVGLSGAFTASGVGLGPFPFVHLLGPTAVQMLPPRASQVHRLRFYLDGSGDAIVLENSALIQPVAAEVRSVASFWILAVVALLMAGGFGILVLRVRS